MLYIATDDTITPVVELRCVAVTPDYYEGGRELAGWWTESLLSTLDRSSYRYTDAWDLHDQEHAFEYHQGIVCPIRRFV
jgi:hypothetical protein